MVKRNKRRGGMKLSTDPQSVAARKRRHRISARFKILQGLVPGGSKMDTVSMLDEAIHYVKFLKTQIWLHQSVMMSSGDTAAGTAIYHRNTQLLPPPAPPSLLSPPPLLQPLFGFPTSGLDINGYSDLIIAGPSDHKPCFESYSLPAALPSTDCSWSFLAGDDPVGYQCTPYPL